MRDIVRMTSQLRSERLPFMRLHKNLSARLYFPDNQGRGYKHSNILYARRLHSICKTFNFFNSLPRTDLLLTPQLADHTLTLLDVEMRLAEMNGNLDRATDLRVHAQLVMSILAEMLLT